MNQDSREQLQNLIGDDYRLQWIIGHGGMSTVWLADDMRHEREVAIKFLKPEFSNNEEFLDRFRNEAIAAESVVSDNVVATYDYREIPDPSGYTNCFIAMEYVRGESLADLLAREGSLEEDVALDVLEQAAHGLSITHRMGLIHRDIKPGNLLITQNGQVKITDFGIAKAAAAVPLTRTGMVVGTAQYVSPEQAQGLEVTAATDVYSLGAVGYEMLAGHRPFTGDSGVSVALAHVNNAPPPLPTSISAEARELIGIALRKDPSTRFADGNELALAVSAVRLGQRPPQPASAAMNQVAQEPSPTASTHLLAQATQPTTISPAAPQRQPMPARPAQVPQPAVAPAAPARRKRSAASGCGAGFLVALIAAAAAGILVWLAAESGLISRITDPQPTTTQQPTVVTEWVTPTEESTTSTPEPVTTTVTPTPTQEYSTPRQTYTPEPTTDTPFAPAQPGGQRPSHSNGGGNSGNGAGGNTGTGQGNQGADDPAAAFESLLNGAGTAPGGN
ncbi:serine/threonine-protein kinase [Corynebacterium tapiri]|uniref:non-specific serine/threonine protein kinase n=1 Tax=Corynebacterium tapiri TaxID=1448266 RepID=A0A5C4U3Y5_9CORY|nr:serine/threonine-protein kinase [Corynebacterium tapiri]TNL96839.1 serine/threonine protein kinase [Corynebacterium tapiri]